MARLRDGEKFGWKKWKRSPRRKAECGKDGVEMGEMDFSCKEWKELGFGEGPRLATERRQTAQELLPGQARSHLLVI